MKMEHFLVILPKKCSICIGKQRVSRTSFRVSGNHSIPIGKVKKMESGNLVLETPCFPMKMKHFLSFYPNSAPFPLENKWFPGRHFAFAEMIVFPLEKFRKWKVRNAFWKPFVFQWKWSILSCYPKSTLFPSENKGFEQRDFAFAEFIVRPME